MRPPIERWQSIFGDGPWVELNQKEMPFSAVFERKWGRRGVPELPHQRFRHPRSTRTDGEGAVRLDARGARGTVAVRVQRRSDRCDQGDAACDRRPVAVDAAGPATVETIDARHDLTAPRRCRSGAGCSHILDGGPRGDRGGRRLLCVERRSVRPRGWCGWQREVRADGGDAGADTVGGDAGGELPGGDLVADAARRRTNRRARQWCCHTCGGDVPHGARAVVLARLLARQGQTRRLPV